MTPTRARLDEHRWHFQHGPIDIVLSADGHPEVVAAAHEHAWHRFTTILVELVAELPALKQPVGDTTLLEGVVARRMWSACHRLRDRFADGFVTPMAAVAGSVADELVASYRRPGIARAWINNGGDIALHLATGASARVGLFTDLARLDLSRWSGRIDVDGAFAIDASMPVRGVATSGWRGRSFSTGIADSVTVLARTSAEADAAATLIANAVDLDDRRDPRIVRRPASSVKDDSDLGDRLVTVDVPPLDRESIRRALENGLARAEAVRAAGAIEAAVLVCQHEVVATMLTTSAVWHAPRVTAPSHRLAA